VWLPIFPGRVICDLGHALFADPQWAVVAFNDHSVLFLERTELNRDLIAQHEFRYISPADLSFSKITPATLKDAAAEADRALARSPDSVTARTAAARTKMMLGDFPSAVVLYAALVEAGHAAETYWRDYGYCLYMGGQHDAADAVFTKMIQQHMLVPYAWYMRHWVAVQKRQWPEAKAFLAKALELEPASQEYQQARQRLEAALKPTPSQQQL